MLPRSPCEQSLAEIENEGVPIDDIDAIFDAIIHFSNTAKNYFRLTLAIALTAFSKEGSLYF